MHSCEAFAHQGCKVYATSRNLDTIGDFQHPGIRKLALDVTSDDAIQRVVQGIVESEGRIDIVVNNAGLLGPGMALSPNPIYCIYFDILVYTGPLIDQSSEDVHKLFDTNTFAPLRMAKTVMPLMALQRCGVIVNIGSIVGELLVVPSSAQKCHQNLGFQRYTLEWPLLRLEGCLAKYQRHIINGRQTFQYLCPSCRAWFSQVEHIRQSRSTISAC
jgi:NAD(P)-dependent dehydrogenase (short-subunit alcohol dehydrogenase family)